MTYMVNTLAHADHCLRYVSSRYSHNLAGDPTAQQAEQARRTFVQDVDALLNARAMLLALESLDDDIDSIGGTLDSADSSMSVLQSGITPD